MTLQSTISLKLTPIFYLYVAISEADIEDIIREDMRELWNHYRISDSQSDFLADGQYNFFPRICCSKLFKFDQWTPGLFREEFGCTEMVALSSKIYCCYDQRSGNVKISSKGLNKYSLINNSTLEKYSNVLNYQHCEETINRGFRVVGHGKICTYEIIKNGLSYFYRKLKVLDDGIHTEQLDI